MIHQQAGRLGIAVTLPNNCQSAAAFEFSRHYLTKIKQQRPGVRSARTQSSGADVNAASAVLLPITAPLSTLSATLFSLRGCAEDGVSEKKAVCFGRGSTLQTAGSERHTPRRRARRHPVGGGRLLGAGLRVWASELPFVERSK